MYVCVCNAVTESAIREAVADGACSLADLERRTGCSGNCGCCAEMAAQVLHETLQKRVACLSALPVAA
jgi:bacterioferritin-associated ferredoxin